MANSSNTSNANNAALDPQKAHIYNMLIVDESGSMSGLQMTVLSGINETLGTIAQAQNDFADKQQQFVSIVTFDSIGSSHPAVRTLIDAQPISQVSQFDNYHPRGCTPLYDAVGQSVSSLYARIKDDKNATGVITIITDGLENDSHEWNAFMVQDLIEKLKAEGWTFSYMGSAHDVKSVTEMLKIDNVTEFSHDVRGTRNTFGRERASRRGYYARMNREFDASESRQVMMCKRRSMAASYYEGRVTPAHIQQLEPGQVFVFGSNDQGMHAGGAAALAVKQFGAVMGQAEGIQGQSYAIPTTGSLTELKRNVRRFINFAMVHTDNQFLVTAVGCGHAGHTPQEVAPLFQDCVTLYNVSLPQEFWQVLGLKMN